MNKSNYKYKYTNCVFYESSNRLLETLENIKDNFGTDKKIAVGRELTKIFEEVKIGTVAEIIDYYRESILKGEIVVMVFASETKDMAEEEIKEKILKLQQKGFSQKDISIIISELYDVNKNFVYKLAIR